MSGPPKSDGNPATSDEIPPDLQRFLNALADRSACAARPGDSAVEQLRARTDYITQQTQQMMEVLQVAHRRASEEKEKKEKEGEEKKEEEKEEGEEEEREERDAPPRGEREGLEKEEEEEGKETFGGMKKGFLK